MYDDEYFIASIFMALMFALVVIMGIALCCGSDPQTVVVISTCTGTGC